MAIGPKQKPTKAEQKIINSEEVKDYEVIKTSNYEKLDKEIVKGMSGGNKGIPMGFNRLNRYVGIRKTMYYLIGGLTGCLSKDTIIEINRKQRSSSPKKYTIEQLYYKFHGNLFPREQGETRNGQKWDLSIPTKIISYKNDLNHLGYNEITNVVKSGVKKVYLLKTKSGKSIKTTKDHKFLIDKDNNFKKLENLYIGDSVYIREYKEVTGRKPRPYRPEITTKLPYYPSSRNKKIKVNGKIYIYQRIKRTRAVYDAGLNNISLKKFINEVKTNPKHTLVFSSILMDIHHLDGNPINDIFENLQLLTKKEHSKLHADIHHFKNRDIIKDEITSITFIEEEMTYDICMKNPYNNFIAEGIIVHNSGKTSFIDDAFVLNPIDWFIKNKATTNIKLKVVYRSMERSRSYKLAKWVARKIFLDQGIEIGVSKLLGWTDTLTPEEYKLYQSYKPYMDEMENIVEIVDGAENPIGIAKDIKNYALRHGKIKKIDEYNNIYVPDDENLITIIVIDHIGLLKTTKTQSTKKAAIDKMSDELRYARDFFGFSPVVVSQFNRSISNPMRIKAGDVEPQLEDFKESANTQDDADVVLALFDPIRYKVEDPSGYDLGKLRDEYGAKYFRSLRLIKNSYGEDDIRVGLAFLGAMGMFKELPKRKDISEADYDAIRNKSFFLS